MIKLIGFVVVLGVSLLWEPTTAFPKAPDSKFAKRSAATPQTLGISEAASYLGKYGYLSRSKARNVEVGGLVDAKSFGKSIKKLQRMLGIPATGKLDTETLSMMTKPRCGVEDTVGVSQDFEKGNHAKSKFQNTKSRRRKRRRQKKRRGKMPKNHDNHRHEDVAKSRTKRYNLEGNRWGKTDLTYSITNYTPDMTKNQVERSMYDALKIWSDKTKLTFREAREGERADINIKFGGGNHGDYYPFDGQGGTLAHAFFPESGEAHFDEDEHYDYQDGDGVNLLIVAAHEFGHALGLAHSNVPNSLMAPIYQGYVADYELDDDDVMAIQQLYGKSDKPKPTPSPEIERTTTTTPTPPRRTTIKPTRTTTTRRPTKTTTQTPEGAMDVCGGDDISFDATFFDDERQYMYAFKNQYYWRFDNEGKFAAGYPQLISSRWRGLPDSISAAAYSRATGRTYFFKSNKIYRFTDTTLDQGFPRPLEHLGLPNNVDAAMQWGGDGLIYVFKKNNFFRFHEYQPYDGAKRYTHRRIAKNWDAIPNHVDAAMQWKDGATYFLKNDEIYKFSNFKLKVDKRYPKDLRKYFIRCPGQKAAPLKYRKKKNKKNNKKSSSSE